MNGSTGNIPTGAQSTYRLQAEALLEITRP